VLGKAAIFDPLVHVARARVVGGERQGLVAVVAAKELGEVQGPGVDVELGIVHPAACVHLAG
jgi:hypothetical protein